ncbi:WXG100 family type VII secretion target [Streptomyces sp. NPDC001661]
MDTGELSDAAPVFHCRCDQLHGALHTFHSRLSVLGAPWGEDEQGSDFQAKYGPARGGLDRAGATLVIDLESTGDALKAMSDNHDENELATKDAFDSAAKEH